MSSQKPSVIRTLKSSTPDLYPDVTVYDSTLEHMRAGGHLQELARIEDVFSCISDPDKVYKSKTHPKSVLAVSESMTSPSGDPLRVPIKVLSSTEAIMTTAYFASGEHGELLYSKKKDE
jgi:hypothetical protein